MHLKFIYLLNHIMFVPYNVLLYLALIRPVFCIGAIIKPNWNKMCKKKVHFKQNKACIEQSKDNFAWKYWAWAILKLFLNFSKFDEPQYSYKLYSYHSDLINYILIKKCVNKGP